MSKIIHMISGPRNISTAMMYAFDNREDCIGVDEPYYGYYLSRFPALDHPMRAEIIASQPKSEAGVLSEINRLAMDSDLLFIKDMAHHIHDLNLSGLLEQHCFLLIRDPKRILASFSKVIAQPTVADIGIIEEWNIYQYLKAHGMRCPIIDTDDFLQNPRVQLNSLCAHLGIDFEEAMLEWESGARAIDGCWAPHWYQAVHQSTGFAAYEEREVKLNPELNEVYKEVLPYYEMLRNEVIL